MNDLHITLFNHRFRSQNNKVQSWKSDGLVTELFLYEPWIVNKRVSVLLVASVIKVGLQASR